jgi:hypothetical protein
MFAPDALDTVFDPVNCPLNFYPGIPQWLAAFEHRRVGEGIEAIPHQPGRALQDGRAFVSRKPGAAITIKTGGHMQRPVGAGIIDCFNHSNGFAIERRGDFQDARAGGSGDLKGVVQFFAPINFGIEAGYGNGVTVAVQSAQTSCPNFSVSFMFSL